MSLQDTVGQPSTVNFTGVGSYNTASYLSSSWVIDSDASDHFVSFLSMLSNILVLSNHKPVCLPNGTTTVAYVGQLAFSDSLKWNHVLFVPSFNFNLLSISKLITSLNCITIFSSESTNEEADWMDEVHDGLYNYGPSHIVFDKSACFWHTS